MQPIIERELETEGGATVKEKITLIQDVPVCFPRTKEFFIAFPLKKGDMVQLIFNQHSLNDAIAIPGAYEKNDALKLSLVDDFIIGNTNGTQICISSSEIKLGSSNANQQVALADKVDAALAKIIAALSAHASAPHGPIAPPVLVSSVASTKVKAL